MSSLDLGVCFGIRFLLILLIVLGCLEGRTILNLNIDVIMYAGVLSQGSIRVDCTPNTSSRILYLLAVMAFQDDIKPKCSITSSHLTCNVLWSWLSPFVSCPNVDLWSSQILP